VQIEEAVPQPHLVGAIRIGRDQPQLSWRVLLHIFDDDRGLRHDSVCRFIAQHRKFADPPYLAESGCAGFGRDIRQLAAESDVVLVERDQHLLAERRQRVVVELECHELDSSSRNN
jgi:hypothetical protein